MTSLPRLLGLALVACKPEPTADPADAPALRSEASKPDPIDCPDDTRPRGQAPPNGNRVWCETQAGVSHGPFLSWHDNGREKTRGAFRHGAAQGQWTTWYDNGQLRSKDHYQAGERVGEWKSFASDGTPQPLEPPPQQSVAAVETTLPSWDLHVGIRSCDEYIDGYLRCLESKVPEATKGQMRDAIEKTVETWKQVADGPGRAALEQTCREALDAVKQTASGWGCDF